MDIIIHTPDNESIHAHCYTEEPTQGTIIIASAMGVGQRFYRHIAGFLAHQGYKVITFDYTGIGKSIQVKEPKKCSLTVWGERDLAAVIDYGLTHNPTDQLFLLGHSLAGQIFPFAPNRHRVTKAYFVASQNVSYRYWSGKYRARVRLFWNYILPISNRIFSGLPGFAYGGKEKIPYHAAQQWRKWGKSDTGAPGCEANGYQNYVETLTECKFVSVENDEMLAPPKAVEALFKNYSSGGRAYQHLEDPQLGHFGFFRKHAQDHWKDVLHWFERE